MYRALSIAIAAAILAVPSVAGAYPITLPTFEPTPNTLYGLDHHKVYEWGIDVFLAPNESVIAAELTFDNIRNWDNNPNDLYVWLLDDAALGVTVIHDAQGGGDYFATKDASTHTMLEHYKDLTTTPQDITYVFTPDEVAALNSYLADDRIGIGFDPDCHYWNCGIGLELTVIPEPASLAMLGLGGFVMMIRKRS
jgi:hypothetical protein